MDSGIILVVQLFIHVGQEAEFRQFEIEEYPEPSITSNCLTIKPIIGAKSPQSYTKWGLIMEIPIFPIILTTNFRFGQDDRITQGRDKSIGVASYDANAAGFTYKSLCCL
jgi:hypothetical protein